MNPESLRIDTLRKARIAKGLCRCGRFRVPGFKQCVICQSRYCGGGKESQEKTTARIKGLRKKRREAGLCVRCAKPSVSYRCLKCRIYNEKFIRR